MSYYYTVVHYTHSNITFGTCLSVVRSREQKGLSREEGRNASNSIASIYRKLGSSTKEKANYAAAVVKGPNPQKVTFLHMTNAGFSLNLLFWYSVAKAFNDESWQH